MRIHLITLVLVFITISTYGQTEYEYPSLSPLGTITQVIGNTEIYIEYERPSVRGRKIFGELVPWDEVWRTGAGNATKIRFSKDVKVGGMPVKAGYYSLFTIPSHDSWTIILNSDTTLYGSYRYKQEDDVARFVAPAIKSNRFYETFTIDIEFIPNNANVYLSWANEQTRFSIKTTTDDEVLAHITNDLLSDRAYDVHDYANGASYLYYQDGDMDVALELAEKAVQTDSNAAFAHAVKIEVLMKMGKNEEAIKAIDTAKKITSAKDYLSHDERAAELEYYNTMLTKIEK